MITYFPRGELTTYLVSQLRSALLVGDAEAPLDGGWNDDPNDPDSSYSPYVVVTPQAAGDGTGSYGDSNSEQRLAYSFASYGVSREQVEFYADLARKTAVNLERSIITLNGEKWSILQARASSMGGVLRDDKTEPSEFSQTDVVTIYVSKEL